MNGEIAAASDTLSEGTFPHNATRMKKFGRAFSELSPLNLKSNSRSNVCTILLKLRLIDVT